MRGAGVGVNVGQGALDQHLDQQQQQQQDEQEQRQRSQAELERAQFEGTLAEEANHALRQLEAPTAQMVGGGGGDVGGGELESVKRHNAEHEYLSSSYPDGSK